MTTASFMSSRRVLVIDDSTVVQETLRQMLLGRDSVLAS